MSRGSTRELYSTQDIVRQIRGHRSLQLPKVNMEPEGQMSEVRGSTALVTGGARGIGRLIGERLLRAGATVVFVDRDETGLARVASEFATIGRVHTRVADLACSESIQGLAEDVLNTIGPVDILVNNAGIVRGGQPEVSDEDHELTLRVNTLGVILTTKQFLPKMIERRRGHIVNIASASSFGGVALMASYAASKWAVLGFSESLIYELQLDGHPISVTSVCPGYIDTGMFDGANPPWIMPFLKPANVADTVFHAIKHNERLVTMPPIMKTVPLMKLLPDRVVDLCTAGINRSMVWKSRDCVLSATVLFGCKSLDSLLAARERSLRLISEKLLPIALLSARC